MSKRTASDLGDDHFESSEPPSKRNNYHFRPLDDQSDSQEGEEEQGGGGEPEELDEEEMKEREQIINEMAGLCARYPSITPRSSNELMDKLRMLSLDELRNVKLNFMNDLTHSRGSPMASAALLPTVLVDNYLPTFSKRCKEDDELKRDIEAELITLFGLIGNKMNIAFRMGQHLYDAYLEWKEKKTREGYIPRQAVPPHGVPL